MTGAEASVTSASSRKPAGNAQRRIAVTILFALVALAGLLLVYTIGTQAVAVPIAMLVGLVAYAILGVAYWWAFTKVPYFAPVARKPRWLAFFWGAAAVGLLAGSAESQLPVVLTASSTTVQGLLGALTAGFLEETIKGLGILAVFLLIQRPRTLVDGFVIGATVGLGCELMEDLAYVASGTWMSGTDSPASYLPVIATRAVTSVSSHWVYSGIVGVGLAYVYCAKWADGRRRVAVLVGCIALAICGHALFDAVTTLLGNIRAPGGHGVAHYLGGLLGWALLGVLAAAIFAVALLVIRWARNREGEFYVTYLVRAGSRPLPEEHLRALPQGVTRRKQRQAAARGLIDREARRNVQRAVRALHRAAASVAVAVATGDAAAESAARSEMAEQTTALAEAPGALAEAPGQQSG